MTKEGLLRCATLALAAATIVGAPARADEAVKADAAPGGGYMFSYAVADGSNPAAVRSKFLTKAGELCGAQGFNFGVEVVKHSGDVKEPFLFTIPVTCGAKPDQVPQAQPGGPPGPPRPRPQN